MSVAENNANMGDGWKDDHNMEKPLQADRHCQTNCRGCESPFKRCGETRWFCASSSKSERERRRFRGSSSSAATGKESKSNEDDDKVAAAAALKNDEAIHFKHVSAEEGNVKIKVT